MYARKLFSKLSNEIVKFCQLTKFHLMNEKKKKYGKKIDAQYTII